MSRPIVLLTDYGWSDAFVGTCHGVIARIAPDVRVIDLTHAIPRQDVMRGAIELARAVPFLPDEAVYVAVVDPGVGSDRRAIATVAGDAILVGPDNGLLSLAWEALGGVREAVEITNEKVMLSPVSRTFHGRDVFAPAAAHLAGGMPLSEMGPDVVLPALHRLDLPRPMVAPGAVGTRVTATDGFGNVQLNATEHDLASAGIEDLKVLVVNGHRMPRAGTFAELPEGEPGLIVDSHGFVAVVVNHGNAAVLLRLKSGDAVVLEGS
jgi:S-adenosyl-L-methionine hydrolase (adenosine-forming)